MIIKYVFCLQNKLMKQIEKKINIGEQRIEKSINKYEGI